MVLGGSRLSPEPFIPQPYFLWEIFGLDLICEASNAFTVSSHTRNHILQLSSAPSFTFAQLFPLPGCAQLGGQQPGKVTPLSSCRLEQQQS